MFACTTEQSKNQLSADVLAEIGNTAWEIQYLGFHNWANTVEGTLRKQDYLIKQLELELARKKYAGAEITAGELKEKEAAYSNAQSELQQFINGFTYAD